MDITSLADIVQKKVFEAEENVESFRKRSNGSKHDDYNLGRLGGVATVWLTIRDLLVDLKEIPPPPTLEPITNLNTYFQQKSNLEAQIKDLSSHVLGFVDHNRLASLQGQLAALESLLPLFTTLGHHITIINTDSE